MNINNLCDLDIRIHLPKEEISEYLKSEIGEENIDTEWSFEDLKEYFWNTFKDFLIPNFGNFEITIKRRK